MPAAGLTLDVVGATGQVQRVPERYSGDEPGVLDVDANLAEGACGQLAGSSTCTACWRR
jgi:hypothetical protein